jgi:hypothetical protein
VLRLPGLTDRLVFGMVVLFLAERILPQPERVQRTVVRRASPGIDAVLLAAKVGAPAANGEYRYGYCFSRHKHCSGVKNKEAN